MLYSASNVKAMATKIISATIIISVISPVLYTAFPNGVLGLTASAEICCSRSCRNSMLIFDKPSGFVLSR